MSNSSSSNLSQRCILAVGNTGNGKSFTATIFGAKNAKVGHSTKSQTDKITIHSIEKGGFYIDTPGFDDSDEDKGDDNTVHSIYLEMLEAKIQNLTTILWFVTPDVRAKGSYKRQAKFIEKLAKYHNGNVWDNTIIVTKGDKNASSAGPWDAAREIAKKKSNINYDFLSKTGDFKILLFESLPLTHIYVENGFSSDKLNNYNVFKGSEPERILARYESLMEEHLKCPIYLDLRKVKCSKCSEETDPRFASPKCHEIESFHPNIERVHRGNVKDIHPSGLSYKHSEYYVGARTNYEFNHNPEAWVIRVFTLGINNPHTPVMVSGYWKCCNNNDANSRGCKQIYRCCDKDDQSPGCLKIFGECRHNLWEAACITICKNCNDESYKNGCKERCKSCGTDDARNKDGCIEISHKF